MPIDREEVLQLFFNDRLVKIVEKKQHWRVWKDLQPMIKDKFKRDDWTHVFISEHESVARLLAMMFGDVEYDFKEVALEDGYAWMGVAKGGERDV